MFFEDLEYKGKVIPQTILGYGPFMAELYYGHRSRLYLDDLYNNPQNTADVIIEAYNQGVRAINLVNNSNLLKAYDLAVDAGCEMKVIATIGKSDVDYLNPNYEVAKEVDWDDDIELFSSYDCPLMLVDEFIVDGYDWKLTSKILSEINNVGSLSGIVTAFPSKTTDLLPNNLDMDLFDFYMIPYNSLSYMMDISAFNASQRQEFIEKVVSLNKKIIPPHYKVVLFYNSSMCITYNVTHMMTLKRKRNGQSFKADTIKIVAAILIESIDISFIYCI